MTADRQVTIRLAVVGGDQVRADFSEVGDSGQRSLGRITDSAEATTAALQVMASHAKQAWAEVDAGTDSWAQRHQTDDWVKANERAQYQGQAPRFGQYDGWAAPTAGSQDITIQLKQASEATDEVGQHFELMQQAAEHAVGALEGAVAYLLLDRMVRNFGTVKTAIAELPAAYATTSERIKAVAEQPVLAVEALKAAFDSTKAKALSLSESLGLVAAAEQQGLEQTAATAASVYSQRLAAAKSFAESRSAVEQAGVDQSILKEIAARQSARDLEARSDALIAEALAEVEAKGLTATTSLKELKTARIEALTVGDANIAAALAEVETRGLRATKTLEQIKAELAGVKAGAVAVDAAWVAADLGMVSVLGGVAASLAAKLVVTAAVDYALRASMAAADQAREAYQHFDSELIKVNNTLGTTGKAVADFAKEVASHNPFSTLEVMGSAEGLLSFKNLDLSAFKQASEGGAELARVLGIALPEATQHLAAALDQPLKAEQALEQLGLRLTYAQEQAIKSALDYGDIEQARAVIMAAVGDKVTALTKETDGLSESSHGLAVAWNGLLVALGRDAEWSIGTLGFKDGDFLGIKFALKSTLAGAEDLLKTGVEHLTTFLSPLPLEQRIKDIQDQIQAYQAQLSGEQANGPIATLLQGRIDGLHSQLATLQQELAPLKAAAEAKTAGENDDHARKLDQLREEIDRKGSGLLFDDIVKRLQEVDHWADQEIAKLEQLRNADGSNGGAIDAEQYRVKQVAGALVDHLLGVDVAKEVSDAAKEMADLEQLQNEINAKQVELFASDQDRKIAQINSELHGTYDRLIQLAQSGNVAAEALDAAAASAERLRDVRIGQVLSAEVQAEVAVEAKGWQAIKDQNRALTDQAALLQLDGRARAGRVAQLAAEKAATEAGIPAEAIKAQALENARLAMANYDKEHEQHSKKSHDDTVKQREANQNLIEDMQHELEMLSKTDRELELDNIMRQLNAAATTEQTAALKKVAEAYVDGLKAKNDELEVDREIEELEDSVRNSKEKLADEVERLNELYGEGSIDLDTYAKKLKQLKDEEWNSDPLKQQADQLGDALGNAFENAVLKGENLSKVLNQLQDDLIKLAMKELVMKPLKSALGDWLGGLGGGEGDGGGLFGGLFSGIGDWLGGLFHEGGVAGESSVPTRALPASAWAGAPRFHDGAYLAPGEVPAILKQGEVVGWPEQLKQAFGSDQPTVVNHFHFPNASVDSFRASQHQVAAFMAQTVAAARRNS